MMYANRHISRMTELTDGEIQALAPAVFSETHKGSHIYKFISTIALVNVLRDSGWKPVFAKEMRANKFERLGFQKHMIAFKKQEGKNWLQAGDGIYPEIVFTNSHDRTAPFEFMAGLFRLICGNGLVVSESTFGSIKIRHKGYAPEQVVNASYKIIENVPAVVKQIETFRKIELLPQEQKLFAEASLIAKHGEEKEQDINEFNINSVLYPRRGEDNKADLWSTFNRVQENLIKGGTSEIGRRRTKTITSINADIKLNRALWSLTEKMAVLKKGR